METRTRRPAYPLAVAGAMAAVMAAVGPFALPVGPVPLSLCTLAIYLAVYALGWRRGTGAVLVYILLGAAGMPVFSGFSGGLGKLAGPTGGFILGYLPLALLAGLAAERFPQRRGGQLLGMVLGTAALYALGAAWYRFQAGVGLEAALWSCVFPFLPGDCAKMAAALAAGPLLRERLARAGLRPGG